MKTIARTATWLLLALTSICALSACDAEDYDMTDALIGEWKVREVQSYDRPPYTYGDILYFSPDGYFYSSRNEQGEWYVRRNVLKIDFTGDGHTDVSATIVQIDYDYLVLDVKDYYYNTTYRLRLTKYW